MSTKDFLHPPAYHPLPTAPPVTPPASPTMYPHLPPPPSYTESFTSPSLSHSPPAYHPHAASAFSPSSHSASAASAIVDHPSSVVSLAGSLQFLLHLAHSAQLGLTSFVQGFLLAWNDTHCFTTQKRSILILLFVATVTYLSLLTIFVPLRLLFGWLFWCLSWVIRPSTTLLSLVASLLDARALWSHVLLLLVPSVAVFISTHCFGFEGLFFSVLRSLHPTLCTAIQSRRKPSFGLAAISFIQRLVRVAGLLLLLSVVSRIVPSLLPYLVVLRYWKLLLSLTVRCPQWMRWSFVLLLVALASLSSVRPFVAAFVHVQLSAMSLSRELLDSYLSRLASPATVKPQQSLPQSSQSAVSLVPSIVSSSLRFLTVPLPAALFASLTSAVSVLPAYGASSGGVVLLSHTSRSQFLMQHSLSLLCFSLPFLMLLSFPVLGFCLLGFAHGSAAVLLVRLLADEVNQQQAVELHGR